MKAKLYSHIIYVDDVNSYLEQDEDCKFRVGKGQWPSPDARSIITIVMGIIFFASMISVVMLPGGNMAFMHGVGAVNTNALMPFLIIIGCMGLFMIGNLVSYLVTVARVKKCDYPVQAKIIMIEDHMHRNRRGPTIHDYYPVYHYYYNGKHYIARSDVSTRKIYKMNGPMFLDQDVTIVINPDKPYSCRMEDDTGVDGYKAISYILCIVVFIVMIGIMLKSFSEVL